MSTSLTTYLINLDGSDLRLARSAAQLDAAGIDYQRVPAFDGRRLSVAEFPDHDAAAARAYMGRALRGGEIGCYLSHLDCARRFLQSGADVGLVLEDDFELVPGMTYVLNQALDWLAASGEDWFLINIGARKSKIFSPIASFAARGQGFSLRRAHYFPMTTTAIVWSRAGAQAFVDGHRTIFAPVDNYFRFWLTRNGRGLCIYPPIAPAWDSASEIDAAGPERRHSGRAAFYGLKKQRRLWQDKVIALMHKYRLT